NVYCSPGDSSRGSTPSHSYFPRNDRLSQQILTTFSPASAYPTNSSHSPPEKASLGSQPRLAQILHSSSSHPSHTNSMVLVVFVGYNGYRLLNRYNLDELSSSNSSATQQALKAAAFSATTHAVRFLFAHC